MPMEFLKVTFPEDRGVKIDGRPAGDKKTNVTLEVEAGTHTVTLEPPDDFTPLTQTVLLKDTTSIKPMEICFKKKPLPHGAG
jgi:hypothetical protein